MRLFGAERLSQAGEDVELRRRHAAWYVEVVSGGEHPWWATGGHVDLIDMLDLEWANIEAALDFCAGSEADARLGLRMASDLWVYWTARGRYRLGFGHLEKLLVLEPTPSPTRAFALWAFGWTGQATGDHDSALAAFEDARRVSEEAGADRELAYALVGLGLIGLRRREPTAIGLLGESLAAFDRVDDPAGRLVVIYFYVTALTVVGKLPEASSLAREGLAATEPGGDTMFRGLVSALVGIVDWQLGDAAAAELGLANAVRIQDRIGHLWGLAISLDGMAWVAAASGRLERAALLLGAVASLWQQLGIVPAPVLAGLPRSVRDVGPRRARPSPLPGVLRAGFRTRPAAPGGTCARRRAAGAGTRRHDIREPLRADHAGAGGGSPGGRRALEPGHRLGAVHLRGDGQNARVAHPPEAGPGLTGPAGGLGGLRRPSASGTSGRSVAVLGPHKP